MTSASCSKAAQAARTHATSGVARIHIPDNQFTTHVPLCDVCFAGDADALVMRKFLNMPDLKISEGGKVTTEQLDALADRQDTMEH